jgi:hypothetical protein
MSLKEQIRKVIISEIAEKIVEKLVQNWTKGTSLNPDVVKDYILKFADISSSLPVEFRDITRLNYTTVKKIVDAKLAKNRLKDLTTHFKTMKHEEGQAPGNTILKKTIRKYNEIYPFLKPEEIKKMEKYTWLKFMSKVNEIFQTHFFGLLLEKIRKEEPTWSQDQIIFYLDNALEYYNEIPDNTPPLHLLSMSEIESVIDTILATKKTKIAKVDTSDIPQVSHPKKNLTIYAPTGKPECIRLANGRSWCTSREGGGNLYYNYRFDRKLTLYYVIDEDLPFDDLNFASVILVDDNGDMRLADGSNSGRFSGHDIVPWNVILSKIPKLDGLKDRFVPKPLTEQENKIFSMLRRMSIPDVSLFEWFTDLKQKEDLLEFDYSVEDLIELWMEINSPSLLDNQYKFLTPELKKKYISLGFDLDNTKIKNSESSVLQYYMKKKLEKLLNKNLGQLNDSEITLLNLPMFQNYKNELKDKFTKEVSNETIGKDLDKFEVDLTGRQKSIANYVKLFGLDFLISNVPENITQLVITDDESSQTDLKFDDGFRKLRNLESITLKNCTSEFPDFIRNFNKLEVISIVDKRIKQVPSWVGDFSELNFLTISNNTKVSSGLVDKIKSNSGAYISYE